MADAVLHLLPIVMVAEAPPRSGLGPLGVLDCDSGLRLARLDPVNDFAPTDAEPARTRRAVEHTLGLFDRVNLLAEHPGRGAGRGDTWPKEQAAEAWRALAPSLAGRRVALVGRAADAAGLRGLPPLRWIEGEDGGPARLCYLPHPSGVNRWYNEGGNRARVGAWLARCRREREDANGAWVAIGEGWAYHLVRGQWGWTDHLGRPRWYGGEYGEAFPLTVTAICGQLLKAATGVRRGGGGWSLTLLDHAVLVADLCTTPGAKRLALAHDLHESPLVGDASSPLKRIMREEWRPVERVAVRAVERLLGLDPTPDEREEVRRADRLALLVEARQVGIDLGDPEAEFGRERAGRALTRVLELTLDATTPADWLRAWRDAGG